MAFFSRFENYVDDLTDRFRSSFEDNRREERENEWADEIDAAANDVSGPAKVLDVDFKAKFNAASHKCDKYELVRLKKATPVLRRGGNFSIDLKLNQEIDLKKQYTMKLFFNFGNVPNPHKGTQAILNVTGKTMFDKNHEHWDARVAKMDGKLLTLEIQIPCDVPVGSWLMAVELKPREGNTRSSRQLLRLDTLIYILFNPWNKHDTTYMAEEDRRQEYVLNDIGKIWQGTSGRHWVFGQFDDVVLPACVLLMERSGVPHESRGDPIFVSRAISKMVNSNDGDNGIVTGRWKEPYSDGTAPSEWSGSIKIMEEYVRRGRSVKYGQCWVFAGVTTTVCRALGLPSRPITNLDSAHDTDVSLTIDRYFDAKGNKISHHTGNTSGIQDSIWNFHVWNEVWMDRPDLPTGYGGWQVIDSTPQERSDGYLQCGPASVEAIRRGEMEHNYDMPFVLAEVNADVVYWQEDEKAQDGFKKLSSDKTRVGRRLLTKKAGTVHESRYGSVDVEDCTTQYKPPEGSKAERVTLQTAARRSRKARHAFRLPSLAEEDVNFSIQDIDKILIGEDFDVTVNAQSTSEKVRSVTIILKAVSTYYTGAPANVITEVSGEVVLQPKQSKTVSLPVPYSKYYDKLVEHAMMKIVAHCRVKETSYAWVDDDCFEVMKPDLSVKALGKAMVGRHLNIRFSFTNPLPMTLNNCVLVIDGPKLTRPKKVPISDVGPKEEMTWEYRFVPRVAGQFVLIATFNSVELINLTGSAPITVYEN